MATATLSNGAHGQNGLASGSYTPILKILNHRSYKPTPSPLQSLQQGLIYATIAVLIVPAAAILLVVAIPVIPLQLVVRKIFKTPDSVGEKGAVCVKMATPSSSPPPLTPEIIATVFLVHPTITGPGQAPLEFRERSSSYDPTLSSSPASFSLLTYNIAGLSPHINVNPPFRRLQEYCTRLEESSK